MVLGFYFLTAQNRIGLKGANNYFSNFHEVLSAYQQKQLQIHSTVWVRCLNGNQIYNTPQDVASNPRSLVQVAEEPHPLLQRHSPANRRWASKQPCARGGCCGRGRCSAWATSGYLRASHTYIHTYIHFVISIIDPPSGGSMRVA